VPGFVALAPVLVADDELRSRRFAADVPVPPVVGSLGVPSDDADRDDVDDETVLPYAFEEEVPP